MYAHVCVFLVWASSFIGDYSRLDSTDLLINMNKLFKTKFATMIRNIKLQSNAYSEISITLSTEGYRSFFSDVSAKVRDVQQADRSYSRSYRSSYLKSFSLFM